MRRNQIIKVRSALIALVLMCVVFVLYSCLAYHHRLSFDVDTQMLSSCDSGSIRRLGIKNDSVKPDGFLYEAGIRMEWEGKFDQIPNEIDMMNIPKEYFFVPGGVGREEEYKLLPNSRYTIEKWGGHNGVSCMDR